MSVQAYERTTIVRDFAFRQALTPAEVAALGEVWRHARGDVLDVGVGGGRTTGYLFGPAHSYRAIDVSAPMVEACRRRFPQVRVEVDDARTLATCGGTSFGLVLFSFNGIDYIGHAERAQVLAPVMRVLRPGAPLCTRRTTSGRWGAGCPTWSCRNGCRRSIRRAWRCGRCATGGHAGVASATGSG